jgi:hypothetical protein
MPATWDLISRTAVDLKEAFLCLVQVTEDMGLKINDDKTKYVVTGNSTISSPMTSVRCYNFQKVASFVYLGTTVNSDSGVDGYKGKARCGEQMLLWLNEAS